MPKQVSWRIDILSPQEQKKINDWLAEQKNTQASLTNIVMHMINRFGNTDIMTFDVQMALYAEILGSRPHSNVAGYSGPVAQVETHAAPAEPAELPEPAEDDEPVEVEDEPAEVDEPVEEDEPAETEEKPKEPVVHEAQLNVPKQEPKPELKEEPAPAPQPKKEKKDERPFDSSSSGYTTQRVDVERKQENKQDDSPKDFYSGLSDTDF